MKRILIIVLVNILALGYLGGFYSVPWPPQFIGNDIVSSAQAAGYTTVNITASNTYMYAAGPNYWANVVGYAGSITPTSGATVTGFDSITGTTNYFTQQRSFFGFDLSTIPADAEIISVNVYLYAYSDVTFTDGYYNTLSAGFYLADVGGTTMGGTDYDSAYNYPGGQKLLTTVQTAKDWGGSYSWREFNMRTAYAPDLLSYSNASDYIWLNLMWLNQMYTAASPPWVTGKVCRMIFTTATKPKLEIKYITSAVDRTMTTHSNSSVASPAPDGVADNISWSTPRMAFSDESIEFEVQGDAGANITLQLVSSSGSVLDTISNSIRTDGAYWWQPDVAASTDTWARCVETNSGVKSIWGYIAPSPSSTMLNLQTYAGSTDYPQYDNSFESYVVYNNDVMTIYWKTNIGSGELSDYNFTLYANGDNTTAPLFSENLTWLNENYFLDNADNAGAAAWRYMKFCPNVTTSGFNTYDGAIVNLGMAYVYRNAGFVTPVFVNNATGAVLTTVHSAYWFLKDSSDYLGISLDHSSYKTGGDMVLTVNAPENTHIPTQLYTLSAWILDSVGNVRGGLASETVLADSNKYNLVAPSTGDDYTLRVELTSTIVPYYTYIHDLTFTVGDGTPQTGPTPTGTGGSVPGQVASGWQTWLDGFLQEHHLDNEGGHWLILLILCLITAIGLRDNPPAATGIICLLIVGAIIIHWLNPWFFVLAAFGAGWFIWGIIRRGLNGRNGGEPPEGV